MAKTPTEKELERIEAKLLSIYGEAGKDLKKKAKRYFERYAKLDAQKKALVEAGELSMDDYTGWRKGQMLTGKRWAELQRQTAQRLVEADKTAAEYVNERLPYIYTQNYNDVATGLKNGLKGYSFELVDEATVRNLAKENKTLLPYKIVDGKKAERWHTGRVNAQITQGILQGESIPNIAKRLYQNVGMTAAGSAVRNARTTVTSAENKGRIDMMGDAEEKGVVMHKIWIAAHDNRTRDAHIELDGDEVEKDEPFVNSIGKIMYPGDPNADPANVYNCRCSLGYKVVSVLGRKVERTGENEFSVTEPQKQIKVKEAKNIFGEEIQFSEKFDSEKWDQPKRLIRNLTAEYNTKLKTVLPGAHQAAGSVQISGTVMHLSSSSAKTVIHEFAHTISMENQTKYGLYQEKDFWGEIKKVQRKYKKNVGEDSAKWISAYAHSSKGADEFMAEAFTQAKMKELGLEIPKEYGNDLTYSEEILRIIDKYYRKKVR